MTVNPADTLPAVTHQWIGEVEWSGESYEFDMTAAWRRVATGELVTDDDSGCSCPSPFEDTDPAKLSPVTEAELVSRLTERARVASHARAVDQVHALIAAIKATRP